MKTLARVLVLGPHTDDGELGCGGTLARMAAEGSPVHYVAFSRAEKTLREHGYGAEALEAEFLRATAALGISQLKADSPGDLIVRVLNYEVRTFSSHRQEILDDMLRLRQEIHPDLVLLPSLHDLHQDHGVIAAEGVRAFKHATVLSYEQPWNNLNFQGAAFVKLLAGHIQQKIDALACYKTQAGKDYMSPDFIRGLARMRGVQAGAEYAEAFEVIRWMID